MIDRLREPRIGGGLLAGGLALTIVGLLAGPGTFAAGYLAGFIQWVGVPIGAAFLLLLHHLTGGRWGWALRPVAGAAALTMPIFLVLLIPVLLLMDSLFWWADFVPAAATEVERHQHQYFNTALFLLRSLVFVITWVALGWVVYSRSRLKEPAPRTAAAAMIVLLLTVGFAGYDWVLSLEPGWNSSVLGMAFTAGCVLSSHAVLTLLTLAHGGHDANVRHDLGNLLLMLVVFHAYLAFSQWLIVWNGNLPDSISWYVPRQDGGWGIVSIALLLGELGLPLMVLLSKQTKRNARPLAAVAGLVLFMRMVESLWLILPSTEHAGFGGVAAGVLAMVGLGAVWLGAYGLVAARVEPGLTALAAAQENS